MDIQVSIISGELSVAYVMESDILGLTYDKDTRELWAVNKKPTNTFFVFNTTSNSTTYDRSCPVILTGSEDIEAGAMTISEEGDIFYQVRESEPLCFESIHWVISYIGL